MSSQVDDDALKAASSEWGRASAFEKWTFSVGNDLLKIGEQRPLQMPDLMSLSEHDLPGPLIEKLKSSYKSSQKILFIPRLMVAMIKAFPSEVYCVVFYTLFKGAGRIALPICLKFFLEALQQETFDGQAYMWAAILSVITVFQMQAHHILYFFTMRMGWNWKSACTGLIYERLFALNSVQMKGTSTGNLVNLISNDVSLFEPFAIFACFSWESVLELAAILYILISLVGVAAGFAGLGVTMMFIPIQIVLASQFSKIRVQTATATDQRVRYTSEIIDGISSVKSYGWENPFYNLVKSLRSKEKSSIETSQLYRAVNLGFFYATPPIAAYVTFAVFWGMDNALSLPVIFSTLSLLRVLQMTIGVQWTIALETGSEAIAACNRIELFLQRSEETIGTITDSNNSTMSIGPNGDSNIKYNAVSIKEPIGSLSSSEIELTSQTVSKPSYPQCIVSMKNANFRYGNAPEAFSLSEISFSLNPGELLIIAGAVGSGKSSLLSAILGELTPFVPESVGNDTVPVPMTPSTQDYIGDAPPVKPTRRSSKSSQNASHLLQTDIFVDKSKKLAYCSQRPWILAASVRANIALAGGRGSVQKDCNFKSPSNVDENLYKVAVESCRIVDDMINWVDYDRTEIGERGISVSGGQKARISLARAVYSDADLLLLDDPLSAVDSHVGKALFFDCILAATKGTLGKRVEQKKEADSVDMGNNDAKLDKKAVVLATHQLQYLPFADKILLLDKLGKQAFYGTYSELSKRAAEFPLLNISSSEDASSATSNQETKPPVEYDPAFWDKMNCTKGADGSVGGRLIIQEEEKEVGQLKFAVLINYLRSGGSKGLWALALIVISQILVMVCEYWLRWWATDVVFDGQRDWRYITVFSGLTALCIFMGFYRAISWFSFSLSASSSLHEKSLWYVMHSPLTFFTANPTGRILNRFSRDQSQIDEAMPVTMFDAIQCAFFCLASVILVCISIPYLLILLPLLLWTFAHVRQKYIKSTREIKRMDATSRSPIFADFSATLDGLSTLRAYELKESFIKMFQKSIYENGRCYFSYLMCARWLGYRLDLISNLIIISIAFIAVALRDTVDVGLIGFALVYSMALSSVFQWAVRQSVEVEVQLTSIERISGYASLPAEEGYGLTFEEFHKEEAEKERTLKSFKKANKTFIEVQQNDSVASSAGSNAESTLVKFNVAFAGADAGRGCVDLDKLTVTYRSDLNPVLTDISCRLPAGSKVGICGRTGSGKSSTLLALLRLNIIKGGDIRIDGESILAMNLEKARSLLTIIPQDPHLFSGSIRFNLDPFDDYSDEEIWSVLRDAHIYDYCARDPAGLSAPVEEGGRNFSVGQRQLLSLARAMLRRSPVVLMDEVTASIDYSTDRLIQSTIRTSPALKNATIITVAHRLRTIADSDLVLVVSAGSLKELDTPLALLTTEGSEFKALAEQSNEFEEILSIARSKAAASSI